MSQPCVNFYATQYSLEPENGSPEVASILGPAISATCVVAADTYRCMKVARPSSPRAPLSPVSLGVRPLPLHNNLPAHKVLEYPKGGVTSWKPAVPVQTLIFSARDAAAGSTEYHGSASLFRRIRTRGAFPGISRLNRYARIDRVSLCGRREDVHRSGWISFELYLSEFMNIRSSIVEYKWCSNSSSIHALE